MGISRIVFSMARSQDLPSLFERIHPRFSTPHYAIAITGAGMIAALLFADLALVVAVSTFAMLLYYLIANIAALRLPREHRKYPPWVPIIGAMSCIGLIVFLSPDSWIIGSIGILMGGIWFVFRRKRIT
jgi:basic amino acid/polyamine antiporter, APA family